MDAGGAMLVGGGGAQFASFCFLIVMLFLVCYRCTEVFYGFI